MRKKKEYLIPCVYHFYSKPMQLVRGEMQYLYDHTGKQYLDCFAGVSVMNCGHCNPDITKAICDQVNTLQHTCTIYLTENIVNLAEALAKVAPGRLQKSFFCASGSEANEGAALLASLYTGKSEFITLRQGLHGRTKLGMSLTGLMMWRTDSVPVQGISFAPNAYCYRCPMNKRYPECDFACANEIETIITTATSGNVAALYVEPVQGNGGIITPPPGYFKRVKEILDKYGILMIVDEVQTGFGRTGKMFASEWAGIIPDIMCIGKALTGGYLSMAATVTQDAIARKICSGEAGVFMHGPTFMANPLSCAVAKASVDLFLQGNWQQEVKRIEAQLSEGLRSLAEFDAVLDVRVLGAIGVVEMKEPVQMVRMQAAFVKEGIWVRPFGRLVYLMPPYVIRPDELSRLCAGLKRVIISECEK